MTIFNNNAKQVYVEDAVDIATGAVNVVDYGHHEIHSGSHYFYQDAVTLGSAGTQDYLITTPNTTAWAHWVMELDGTAVTTFELYESSDKTGTTLQTIYNNNRNSANASGLTIHKGTSGGTTDGTLLRKYAGGTSTGATKTTSLARSDLEMILKQNAKYILRVTSGTAGNLCNVKFLWYEHTSK